MLHPQFVDTSCILLGFIGFYSTNNIRDAITTKYYWKLNIHGLNSSNCSNTKTGDFFRVPGRDILLPKGPYMFLAYQTRH